MANCHIIATVDQLSAITHFYGAVHMKKEGHLWDQLMVIMNKIITGEAISFGGVFYLLMHWVSVAIDFQQLHISYGDSLRQQMPKHEHRVYKQWIKHLVNQSIKIPANR